MQPQPQLESVHVNVALDNVAIGYKNPLYVLRGGIPTIPVKNKNGTYFIFDKGSLFRNEAEVVRPGGRAPRVGLTVTTSTYATLTRKAAVALEQEVVQEMDPAVRAVTATNLAMSKVRLAEEIHVATAISGATWGNGAQSWATGTGQGQWTTASSDILAGVEAAKLAIYNKIGIPGNSLTAIINYQMYHYMRQNDGILERIISGGTNDNPANVNLRTITQVLDLGNLIIVPGKYESAREGLTSSMADIWPDSFFLGYLPTSPGLLEPSAAYIFEKTGPMMRSWREEPEDTDVVEAKIDFVCKQTLSEAGVLYTDCLA